MNNPLGFVVGLAWIAVIALFLYTIYAVVAFKSEMRKNIQYLRETAETEEEVESVRLAQNLHDDLLNAAAPLLVISSFILLSFIIALFDFDKGSTLFIATIFLISPICIAVSAIFFELNVKIRHRYGVYDTSEDLKDHASATFAFYSIASNLKKLAGSGKRQTDYFKSKNKKI
ncbi:hypothetical protein [Treponema berlinense]|uniref:hypothetical protein n=1 Tax=Treponema berlinense TaxID=225004 RepID=UPI003FD86BB0